MGNFVGIVILNFNRWDVSALCLDSLYRARGKVPFKVYFVENSTLQTDREKSERFCRGAQNRGYLEIDYLPQAKNLGYPAGNNVGIRKALEDPRITHICLLNNDTIATPNWLEDLVEYAGDDTLVSPVSNSVGNEQIVLTDYPNRGISGYMTQGVFKFAAKWRAAHMGNTASAHMLCFFCILGSRQIFEKVGLLDEAFGIGNFEDDDFCFRTTKAGFSLKIVRQTFVHHWGSATMNLHSMDKRVELFRRNQKIFETKHGIKWSAYQGAYIKAAALELNWLESQGRLGYNAEAELLGAYQRMMTSAPTHFTPPEWLTVPQPARRLVAQAMIDRFRSRPVHLLASFLKPIVLLFASDRRAAIDEVKRLCSRVFRKLARSLGYRVPNQDPSAKVEKSDGKRKRILFLPIQTYHGRRQRPQHIAEGLADLGYDVDWIEPESLSCRPGEIDTIGTIQRENGNIRLLRLSGVSFQNYWTSAMARSEAQTVATHLKTIGESYAAIVCEFSFWLELCRELKLPVLYDCMDSHSDFGSATLEVALLEDLMLGLSNQIVVSSTYLEKYVRAKGLAVHAVVRNGCHTKDFPLHAPPETQPRKTVGYFGAIAEWFDHELLLNVAQRCPEVDFEIIGNFDISDIRAVKLPSNVHLRGEKPYHELPELTRNWSAGMIPFRITPLIEATNPVKFYEYSALGLPVVSTAIPEVIQIGAEIDIYVGDTPEAWERHIRALISEDSLSSRLTRRGFAEKNTWRNRAESIASLLKAIKRVTPFVGRHPTDRLRAPGG